MYLSNTVEFFFYLGLLRLLQLVTYLAQQKNISWIKQMHTALSAHRKLKISYRKVKREITYLAPNSQHRMNHNLDISSINFCAHDKLSTKK